MDWLSVTLEVYRRCFARAAQLALKNWPVLGSVFAYVAIISVTARFAAKLGLAGGFLLSLVMAACVGSFLYLVEMIVRTSRVSWADFSRSFGVYLWDVVGVSFTMWLFWKVATPLLMQIPQGGVVILCVNILIVVFLNAVPELIYLGHHSLVSLLSESYRFVADNWIEWFPPNVLAMVALAVLWQPMGGGVVEAIQTAAVSLFVYFTMVMRGLLFMELSGTTRRGRAFRHRAGGA